MVWNIPAETQVPQGEGGNFLSFLTDGRSPAWENCSLHHAEGGYAKEDNDINTFSPYLTFIVSIHIRTTTYCQSDWISAVVLDSASLKTTFVDLIVALQEMSEKVQVPQDFSSGHRGYLYQSLWRSILEIDLSHDTEEPESHKCGNVLFCPLSKATSMHESINRMWQTRLVENKEVNKLNRSLHWMFLKAVSHCFSRWSRQLSASSTITVDERKMIIFLNQVFR